MKQQDVAARMFTTACSFKVRSCEVAAKSRSEVRQCSVLDQPLTLNPEPNSIRNPLPSLANNTTLENIDGVIGYSYTCVVVIYWVECRGEYRNNHLMGKW